MQPRPRPAQTPLLARAKARLLRILDATVCPAWEEAWTQTSRWSSDESARCPFPPTRPVSSVATTRASAELDARRKSALASAVLGTRWSFREVVDFGRHQFGGPRLNRPTCAKATAPSTRPRFVFSRGGPPVAQAYQTVAGRAGRRRGVRASRSRFGREAAASLPPHWRVVCARSTRPHRRRCSRAPSREVVGESDAECLSGRWQLSTSPH